MTESLTRRIREFVDTHVIPLEPAFLYERHEPLVTGLAAIRAEAKRQGLWAPHLSEDLGGLGLTLTEFAAVSEELGRSPLGHVALNCQAPDIGNMELLERHGSADQRARWLEPLARGEIRSAFAMTEPDRAGSNPVWLDTTAVTAGDEYVINGRKWFASAANGASFLIVMAVTSPDAPPHGRASQIIVPSDTPGVRHVRIIRVMGDGGAGYGSHSELDFENVRVPRSNRIGAEGSGFALAQERLGPGRIHHGMRWIGICERALDLMCRRAASRELAPGRPLAFMQAVQHMIAESRAEINAARLLILDAAQAIDARGASAARDRISLLKFFAAGVLQRVLDRSIQVHGALGMTDDTPLAYWYRHERAARIYDGADEVHKSAVARRILRNYGVRIES